MLLMKKQRYKKIANHLVDNCGYDGVNLLNASDESAGQSVPHFHIHIIPRKNNDGIDAWPRFNGAKYDIEEVFCQLKIDKFQLNLQYIKKG